LKSRHLVNSLSLGLCTLLVAFILSQFVTYPELGFRFDISKMPLEAQAIMNETPGEPITPEQWRRFNKVLEEHGWSDRRELFFQSVLHSWYWFLICPLMICMAMRARWQKLMSIDLFLICSPCVTFLMIAAGSVPLQ
jgi:hypothetical protein